MNPLLSLLATLWRGRGWWAGFALAGFAIGLLASLSIPSTFTAKATLQVDQSKSLTPLLSSLKNPGHIALLNDVLASPGLLADTARDSGVVINPSGLKLTVPSEHLISIAYTSDNRHNLEKATDTLAYNFIYELLAPERLRLEQRVASLRSKLAASPTALSPSQQTLQKELTQLEEAMSAIVAAFDQGTPQAVIWFAEPARMEAYTPRNLRHMGWALNGLLLGLLAGLAIVFKRTLFPKGPKDEKTLSTLTGLPVLGLLPDIGTVQVASGQPQILTGQTTLNPTGFAEVIRLHRVLTRGLHGSLVLTGIEGGEGTSLLALLLAQRSAQTGKPTLLIDLNLKNTWLSKTTQTAAVDWKLPTRKSKPNMADITSELGENLSFLPAPSDTASLSYLKQPENAQVFLDSLSSHYAHIIIDTSPVLALNRQNADPVTLVGAATRSVLLAMMTVTPRGKIEQVSSLLTQHGNLIGVVGNNLENPSPKVILMGALSTIGKAAPGLAAWLRAKLQRLN